MKNWRRTFWKPEKKNFWLTAFRGASLRDIAASLGVTTGAIYRYYTDKAELFSALVEKPARELEERYRAAQKEFADQPLQDQLTELPEVSDENSWIMEFIYDNFDAFKLIVCCSAGTGYEHYLDTLVEIEANSGRALLERMEEAGQQIHQIDDALIHIVSSALFNGIFETVRHDMPRDKAFVYLNDLKEFYSAGWFKLLGMS